MVVQIASHEDAGAWMCDGDENSADVGTPIDIAAREARLMCEFSARWNAENSNALSRCEVVRR